MKQKRKIKTEKRKKKGKERKRETKKNERRIRRKKRTKKRKEGQIGIQRSPAPRIKLEEKVESKEKRRKPRKKGNKVLLNKRFRLETLSWESWRRTRI